MKKLMVLLAVMMFSATVFARPASFTTEEMKDMADRYIQAEQMSEFILAEQKLDLIAKNAPEYAGLIAGVKEAHQALRNAFNPKDTSFLGQTMLYGTENAGSKLENQLTAIEEKDLQTGKAILPRVEAILQHKYPVYYNQLLSLKEALDYVLDKAKDEASGPVDLQAGLFLDNLCYAGRIARINQGNREYEEAEKLLQQLSHRYPGNVRALKNVRAAHRKLAFALEGRSMYGFWSEVSSAGADLGRAFNDIKSPEALELAKSIVNHAYKFKEKQLIPLGDILNQNDDYKNPAHLSSFFAEVIEIADLAKKATAPYMATDHILSMLIIQNPAYAKELFAVKASHKDILKCLNISRERAEFEEQAILERLEDIGPSLSAQLEKITDKTLRKRVGSILNHDYQFRGTQVIRFHEVLNQVAGYFQTTPQWGPYFDELQAAANRGFFEQVGHTLLYEIF